MSVKCGDKVFDIAPWMFMQVEDIKKLGPLVKALNIKLHFHGDGLLQHVAKELGFQTDYENQIRQSIRIFAREFKHKSTILWQAI